MIERKAAFSVGDIQIFGDLILAPMRGYSDMPYRSICRSLGSAMSYTAFAGAIELLANDPAVWHSLGYQPQERPVVFQIYDSEEELLLAAAKQVRSLNPDILDVNMGCSIRGITSRGAGAGLLRDRKKVGNIIKILSSTLDIPVSAKIRLGWDQKSKDYLEIAQTIEDNGGALLAVHARTRDQGFSGHADWDAIASIKQSVSIPVIGNGDVKTIDDIEKLKNHTHCDAIMIGRAAKGNPWIFQRRRREHVPQEELAAVVYTHLEKMIDFYGERLGLLRFRKHLAAYIKPMQLSSSNRIELLTCKTKDQLIRLLKGIDLLPTEDVQNRIISPSANNINF